MAPTASKFMPSYPTINALLTKPTDQPIIHHEQFNVTEQLQKEPSNNQQVCHWKKQYVNEAMESPAQAQTNLMSKESAESIDITEIAQTLISLKHSTQMNTSTTSEDGFSQLDSSGMFVHSHDVNSSKTPGRSVSIQVDTTARSVATQVDCQTHSAASELNTYCTPNNFVSSVLNTYKISKNPEMNSSKITLEINSPKDNSQGNCSVPRAVQTLDTEDQLTLSPGGVLQPNEMQDSVDKDYVQVNSVEQQAVTSYRTRQMKGMSTQTILVEPSTRSSTSSSHKGNRSIQASTATKFKSDVVQKCKTTSHKIISKKNSSPLEIGDATSQTDTMPVQGDREDDMHCHKSTSSYENISDNCISHKDMRNAGSQSDVESMKTGSPVHVSQQRTILASHQILAKHRCPETTTNSKSHQNHPTKGSHSSDFGENIAHTHDVNITVLSNIMSKEDYKDVVSKTDILKNQITDDIFPSQREPTDDIVSPQIEAIDEVLPIKSTASCDNTPSKVVSYKTTSTATYRTEDTDQEISHPGMTKTTTTFRASPFINRDVSSYSQTQVHNSETSPANLHVPERLSHDELWKMLESRTNVVSSVRTSVESVGTLSTASKSGSQNGEMENEMLLSDNDQPSTDFSESRNNIVPKDQITDTEDILSIEVNLVKDSVEYNTAITVGDTEDHVVEVAEYDTRDDETDDNVDNDELDLQLKQVSLPLPRLKTIPVKACRLVLERIEDIIDINQVTPSGTVMVNEMSGTSDEDTQEGNKDIRHVIDDSDVESEDEWLPNRKAPSTAQIRSHIITESSKSDSAREKPKKRTGSKVNSNHAQNNKNEMTKAQIKDTCTENVDGRRDASGVKICKVCKKVVKTDVMLKKHMKLHKSDLNQYFAFKCQICSRMFMAKASLQRHEDNAHEKYEKHVTKNKSTPLKIPSGTKQPANSEIIIASKSSFKMTETLYKCSVCGRHFGSEFRLKNHMIIHTQNPPYKCPVCNKTLASINTLLVHTKIHTGDKHFACAVCGKTFICKTNMQNHERIHSGEKPYRCRICEKGFKNMSHRIRHEHIHGKIYDCKVCAKSFKHYQDLRKHKKTHTVYKVHKCSVCLKVFPKGYQLKEHRFVHTGIKIHKCEHCQRRFAKRSTLNTHMKMHAKKFFKCKTCGESFILKSSLVVHLRRHTGQRPFGCQYCDKKFLTNETLKIHKKIHTNERPYQCPLCPRAFKCSGDRLKHHRRHLGIKMHTCDLCDKTFADKRSMRSHRLGHTGELPQQCRVCSKRFRTKASLERHTQVHIGKQFECSVCQTKLSSRNSLKRHIRTHTGEKPYKCVICDKSFTDSAALTIHARTHTGEKPFKCKYCDKLFPSSDRVKIHEESHAGIKRFECQICKQKFKQKQSVEKHLQSIHNIVNPKDKAKIYNCTMCKLKYKTDQQRRDHEENVHMKEKTFVCPSCSLKFRFKHQLNKHMIIHSESKDYKCVHCGQQFKYKNSCTVHERKHTGEKPYKCTQCGKNFMSSAHLWAHKFIHNKTFKCDICGKMFSRKLLLEIHLRAHTGVKPFQCRHCPKTFASKTHLNVHIKTYMSKGQKCKECGLRLKTRRGFESHMANHNKSKR